MIKSKDVKVQEFLDEMMIFDDKKFDILQELRQITFKQFPKVSERIIYWGIMFSLENDIWWIFPSKKHTSFEYSNGYLFDDPKKFLEGTWKFRRHLKIRTFSDILNKEVDFFVKQCTK